MTANIKRQIILEYFFVYTKEHILHFLTVAVTKRFYECFSIDFTAIIPWNEEHTEK